MTASALLRELRSRGFTLRVDAAELVVSGPRPRDESRAVEQLRAHRTDLMTLLETERHPTVSAALQTFTGSVLREVRPTVQRTINPLQNSGFHAESALSSGKVGRTRGPGRSA